MISNLPPPPSLTEKKLRTVAVEGDGPTMIAKGHQRADSIASAATTEKALSDSSHSDGEGLDGVHLAEATRTSIKGVGLCFNRAVGTDCLRTGCSIHLDMPVQQAIGVLRKNILEEATRNPQCSIRLMVQGSQFWYSTADAEAIYDQSVIVADSATVAHARRRSDAHGDALPAQVCVVEPLAGSDGKVTVATWLFRHDVLDGWRCLRYLTSLLFAETELTVDRLRARHAAKSGSGRGGVTKLCVKAAKSAATLVVAAALTPAALYRLASVCRSPSSKPALSKFYLHATVSVKALKALGKAKRLGSLSNTLTAAITAAYFAADPTARQAKVASNLLFDADAPEGNHVCLKVATVHAPPKEGAVEKRAATALRGAARTLRASSQKLVDSWIAMASRAYVLGRTPERWNPVIEARQQALDILVSNLPAFDVATPTVLDLQVSRDYDNWAPSIVYAIGVEDNIFLDFYWGIAPTFDKQAFIDAFTQMGVGATNVHEKLPECY